MNASTKVLAITFCAMYLHRATNASSMLEGGHAGFGNVKYRSADKKSDFLRVTLLYKVIGFLSALTWQIGCFHLSYRCEWRVCSPLLRRLLRPTDPHVLLHVGELFGKLLPTAARPDPGPPLALTCRMCCSRFHGSSFCPSRSVRCASCSASMFLASCSAGSPFLYFCTASCEDPATVR